MLQSGLKWTEKQQPKDTKIILHVMQKTSTKVKPSGMLYSRRTIIIRESNFKEIFYNGIKRNTIVTVIF